MNTTKSNNVTSSGIITVYDEKEKHEAFNVPEAGSGKIETFFIKDIKPLKIHMIGIPSAATIYLRSKKSNSDGTPEWWMSLKTTNASSHLDEGHIDQYVNRNAKDSFIRTALGMLVIDKSDKPATPETLGSITIQVSDGPRQTPASTPGSAGE